ncbi:MAG: hypothetical protein ACYDEJ_07500 [Desulfitobacteriaceae bacterium]
MKRKNVLLLELLLCVDVMLFPFFLYKKWIWIWVVLTLFSLVFWPLKLLLIHKMYRRQESWHNPTTLNSKDSNLIASEMMIEDKPKEALSQIIEESNEGILEQTPRIITGISSSKSEELTKEISEELAKAIPVELVKDLPEEYEMCIPEELAKDIIKEKHKDSIEEEIWLDQDKRIEKNIAIETEETTEESKAFSDIKIGVNLLEDIYTQDSMAIKEDPKRQKEIEFQEEIENQEDKFTNNENRLCEISLILEPEQYIKNILVEKDWLFHGKPKGKFRIDDLPENILTEMLINMIDQGFKAKNAGQLKIAAKWFNATLTLRPKPDLAVSLIMDVVILWKASGCGDLALERLEQFWGEYQNKLSPDLRSQFNRWLAKENLQDGN